MTTPAERPTWNVLVLPSVNEPGLEIVRSLRHSPRFCVFGASSIDTACDPSVDLLANHTTLPALGDPAFEDSLRTYLDQNEIDFVFPTVDALVAELASYEHPRARFVTPDPATAALCCSKRETAARLAGVVPVAREYTAHETPTLPLFAKPDRGAGSRDTFVVRDEHDLRLARARGLMLLEYLPGDEYTVDCCGDAEGRLLVASIRRRAMLGRGIALASELVADAQIDAMVRAVAQELRIVGPFFVQWKRRADGTPVLLEVNARVGGSMGLTRLAGANIPQMAVFSLAGYSVKTPRLLPGLRGVRSLETRGRYDTFSHVVWDLDDTLIRKDGKPDPAMFALVLDLRNRGIGQTVLSRNVDPAGVLKRHGLAELFDEIRAVTNKVPAMSALLEELGLRDADVVMINDSWVERLALEAEFKQLLCIAPDGVDLLLRERWESPDVGGADDDA
jgi:carbamoyl-phosphate synthase large subunit